MRTPSFSRAVFGATTVFLLAACSGDSELPTDLPGVQTNGSPDSQVLTLCKTGPEGSWATFDISATGGQLLLGSEVDITDVRPFGENPPACVEVWGSAGSDIEQVTITETGATAGTVLDDIVVIGMGYSVDLSTATATVDVNDQNGATVIFKNSGVPEQPGTEGCTPGFWRQSQHYEYWTGYAPGDSFASVFGVAYAGTLLEAVWAKGGKENALARHAVAALLNSTSADVDYPLSTSQVIASVQSAFADGDFEEIKDYFEGYNELGCEDIKD